MIPGSLKNYLNEKGFTLKNAWNAAGGSINRAAQVEVADKGHCFLKWNATAPFDMFRQEVKGLNLLNKADSGLRVPSVIDYDIDPNSDTGYLLLEYLPEGRPGHGSHQTFGRQLAKLHQNTNDQYGLDHDNYIGRLPQSNSFHDEWIPFFIDERLEPQYSQARDSGYFGGSVTSDYQQLCNKLDELLPEEPASLLHGDLWGGNYFFTTDAEPAIYDPAVYYGNREIELAFTHLFGGFSPEFYRAYEEAWPLQPGFKERIDLYNLYPLLVHTNLFGGGYARQVESIIRQYA